jgi:hypothetical protein
MRKADLVVILKDIHPGVSIGQCGHSRGRRGFGSGKDVTEQVKAYKKESCE